MLLIYFAFWIILNNRITPEIIIFGVVISFVLTWMQGRLFGYDYKKDIAGISTIPYMLVYIFALMIEISKASLIMSRAIIAGTGDERSVIVKFRSPFRYKWMEVVLANSITLTPGTISVSIKDDTYMVHCYNTDMAEGLDTSRLVRILLRTERVIYRVMNGGEQDA